MKQTALFRLLLAFAVIFALSSFSFAQNITGNITGTVHDQSGAVIRGVQVTLTNSDTGIEVRKATTDSSGIFTAPLLPVGHYVITASSEGFAESKITNIDLHVNDQLKYDVTLKPAGTTTGIVVEAEPIQVETQTPTAAGLINGTQIRELSLNNRNYEQLVALQPGVSYGGGDQLYVGLSNPSGETNVVSFAINGQRNSQNNWTVDGADNVDRGSNLTLLNFPSVDAIAEFKTLRGLYNAEFGRNAAGQINVVTKSGTDKFHGDVYEFFRNDVFNANTFLNKQASPVVPRNPLRYNNFGYTIGGPVKFSSKPANTFFFFSQEFRRVITYSTREGTVPTASERAGIFESPVCTSVAVVAGTASCAVTGTQITAINPLAQQYLTDVINKLPLPNDPSSGPNTLLSQFRNVFNARQELVRLDHNFGSRLSVAFRFINDDIPTIEPGGLFTGAALPGVATTSTNAPGRSYLGRFTFTITPTFLIDGGYAYSQGAIISHPTGTISSAVSTDVAATLPFPSTLARIPSISFRGGLLGSNITSFGPYADFNRNHNPFINLTKIMGNHALKFGASYNHYEKTENAAGNNAGTFDFRAFSGEAPAGTDAYLQSFANFLSGYVNNFTQDSFDITPDINTNQWEVYGQDEWKVRRNVALTYGVRWSYFQQPYDANGLLTNFDPHAYNPSAAPVIDPITGNIVVPGSNPLNGILVNGQSSPFGNRVAPNNNMNFAPRIGLAWDIFGDGKTSLRTGYGIAYDSYLFGIYEQNIFANPPFVNSVSLLNTSFSNPSSGTPNVSAAPLSLHATPNSNATPYTQQWSLDLQQELPAQIVADIGYYGAKGTHLIGIADINQPLPGAYLTQLSPAALTAFNAGNEAVLNTVRPYVGYGPINAIEPWFGSNYHSLQASLQKRFRGGSLIDVAYTWSHALTNAQTDRSNPPQNTYCTSCEYGASQLDRRNVLTANFVYDLPWLRDQRGFTGHVLGGWEISGIIAANSGLPINVVDFASSLDPLGQGIQLSSTIAQLRPDQISDPTINSHRFNQWFDPNAFASVPAGQIRVGNVRPGSVIGPGFVRVDTSLFKNFKITESTSLQFRAEAFNVLNHTNFDTVDRGFGDPTFGQVTGTRDPRILQVALKLYF